jgi:hypothetical protein
MVVTRSVVWACAAEEKAADKASSPIRAAVWILEKSEVDMGKLT